MHHWDLYWQTTHSLNSFVDHHSTGYKDEVEQFWLSCFSQHYSTGKILDIATGNGSLAVAAQRYLDQHGLQDEVWATDAADINPVRHFSSQPELVALLQKINFYPKVQTEQLPFLADYFSLAVSQFGFEYAQVMPAFQQVFRVLKPGGRFQAIVHHANSFISEDTDNSLKLLDMVLVQLTLTQDACSVLEYAEQKIKQAVMLKTDAHFSALNQQLIAKVQQFYQHCINSNNEAWFNAFAADFIPLLTNLQTGAFIKMTALEQSLVSYRLRLAEQKDCCWSESQVQQLKTQLSASEWQQVQIEPFYTSEGLYGWALSMVKAG